LPVTVSDAGPLIHLAQINQLRLIKSLFKQVLITARVKQEVLDEGLRLGHADAKVIGEALEEGWIAVEPVHENFGRVAKKLAEGENISQADAETLLLAKAKKADLLVDDKSVWDLAKMFSLRTWNTWTVLLESLGQGLIEIADLENAIKELGEKRHKLKEKQALDILRAAKHITLLREERKRKQHG
jgi:predicted nucleic acid-binding protein